MRYYKTVQDASAFSTVEKQLERFTKEYPKTFRLIALTHMMNGKTPYTMATFSWDDDEDSPGYEGA